MEYEHTLKVVEYENCYMVYLDEKLLDYVTSVKIERELKPLKENELNRVIVKYDEFEDEVEKKNPQAKELILEGVKLEFS